MRAAFTTFATAVAWLGFTSQRVSSFEYDPRYVGYNLNENPNANGPLEYWGKWQDVSSILVSPCYIYIYIYTTTTTTMTTTTITMTTTWSPPPFSSSHHLKTDHLLTCHPHSINSIHLPTIGGSPFTLSSSTNSSMAIRQTIISMAHSSNTT